MQVSLKQNDHAFFPIGYRASRLARLFVWESLGSSAGVVFEPCSVSMPREREPEGSVRDADALESLTDKLRSGEFSDAIAAAQRATEQQGQLCLQPNGGVKRADPHSAFVAVEAAPEEEDELMRLRRERKAQLQKESVWKKQGPVCILV